MEDNQAHTDFIYRQSTLVVSQPGRTQSSLETTLLIITPFWRAIRFARAIIHQHRGLPVIDAIFVSVTPHATISGLCIPADLDPAIMRYLFSYLIGDFVTLLGLSGVNEYKIRAAFERRSI